MGRKTQLTEKIEQQSQRANIFTMCPKTDKADSAHVHVKIHFMLYLIDSIIANQ